MVWVVLFMVMAVQNLSPANASAIALTRHGERAGTASAGIGFLQSVMPAIGAPVVGLLGNESWAMGLVMAVAAGLALAILALVTPLYREGGVQAMDKVSQVEAS